MKVIVGLGNPGDNYRNNRHNVGHMAVDALLKKTLPRHFVVKKSEAMMNDSGNFVKKLVEQHKLNLSDLWVIHDDLDIPLGSFKIQKGKGPKLHNGILSIEKQLESDEFWRVRIGVDNRDSGNRTLGEEYILQDFTEAEKNVLGEVINQIVKDLTQKLIV